ALSYAFQENRRRRLEVLDKQALLAAIVENANDAIVAEDNDGRITGWNHAAEKIFGYPARDALHRSGSDFLWPENGRPAITALRHHARAGVATAAFDTIGRHEDGTELDIAVTAAPIISTNGNISGVGFTIRDIRERRAAEKAQLAFSATLERQVAERTAQLETARKDLQTILDAVPSMIGYWDRNLINRVANRAYADWFNIEPDKLPGHHIRDLLGDELFDRNRPYMEAALRGEPQTFERAIPKPDGKGVRHSLAHYLPDIVDGEVLGFYVLVHDINEVTEGRQRLADALRENEALLATIKLHALFTETAADGTILEINDSLCRIIGYRREELVGRSIRLLDADGHDDDLREMWRTLDAGAVWRGDLCNRAKDGSLHWFETIIAPFVDNEGKVTKFLSLRTEITARLATDKALLEAKRAAEAANAAKSAFLANMSHEIRTPLNAVIGLGHLLQRTALDEVQGDYVAKSLAASNSLLALVDDILDLAKIEAGEMDIESVPFDPNALLADLKAVLAGQIAAKGLAFALVIETPLPPIVLGDPTRLRQILLNLLSNAIKFSDRGGIKISVRSTWKSATERSYIFQISDTGIGIAPDVLTRLFTPFEQADSSTTRRFGGTGLGLSIVRHLTHLLSGSVEVVSEEGKGSTFTVTLPLGTPQPIPNETPQQGGTGSPMTREPPTDTLSGVRILVVDDAAVNLEICSRILAHYGAKVSPHSDGRSALEALRAAPEDFDIVVTDVQMPGIDGVELARRIRKELHLEHLPVIALSADVLTTERQRALQAGMNDFVLKPFDPIALVKLLRSHAEPRRSEPRKPGGGSPPEASRWSIVESIHGIDAAEADLRLNGDGDLFMSALARLLEDCRDMPDDDAGWSRSELAARLHRLRGSAGSIGATTLARLAGALEAQLSEGADNGTIHLCLTEIRAAIDDLRQSSKDALASLAPAGPASGETEGREIAALARMLERHDLAAVGAFTTLAPVLKARLPSADFEILHRTIAALQFEEALAILGRMTDQAG
ncbi:MAG: PAS domain S-box protein, partial [Zavarzinia sp.]|nr:PAS domain S-box protein [Zavarzinia sp.]